MSSSTIPRRALQNKDVNVRSKLRLPQPSKLKMPTATLKRIRSSDEKVSAPVKKAKVEKQSAPVGFKPKTTGTGYLSRTSTKPKPFVSKPMVSKPVRGPVSAKPTRSVIGGAPQKKKAATAPVLAKKKSRPAWDIKGRLEDTEAALMDRTKLLDSLEERFNAYVNENSQLKGAIELTVAEKSQASMSVKELERKLADLEDDFETKKRKLQRQVEELEETRRSLKRSLERLETDLSASQQECGGLKTSIAQMTSAHAGVNAELSSTKLQLNAANELNLQRDAEIHQLKEMADSLKNTIQQQERKIREDEDTRRKLHNTIQELKGNIRVFCRVRPLIGSEAEDGDMHHINFPDVDSKMVEVDNLKDSALNESVRSGNRKFQFTFDRVFSPESSQMDVFREISQLVQSALDGYNVCIFAYGQTGSGKTFTMEGPAERSDEFVGMIPRAVEQIFKTANGLKEKGWEYQMEASFLEIYNETIRDLLGAANSKYKHDIRMVGNKSKEVEVTNINIVEVTTEGQVHKLLEKASRNRAVAATNYNERSSRSHSVFRLKLMGKNTVTDLDCQGTLNLVDLAGSERLPQEGYEGDRLKEMKNINKSLSNLGQVILALGNKDSHVPYRNSKLTHLLQDSLGGNSKTLMFVNISPKEENFQETLCSLRFAVKVNECNIGTAQQKRVK